MPRPLTLGLLNGIIEPNHVTEGLM